MSILDLIVILLIWIPLIFLMVGRHFISNYWNCASRQIAASSFKKRVSIFALILVLGVPAIQNYSIIKQIGPRLFDPGEANRAVSILSYRDEVFLEVINYYQSYMPVDSGTTMGFGLGPLLHFTEMQFIELAAPPNVVDKLDLLNQSNISMAIDGLLNSDVKYFLFPKSSAGFRFNIFEVLSSNTNLFYLILNSTFLVEGLSGKNYSFIKAKDFTLFGLYALVETPRITEEIKIIDENSTEFWELVQDGEGEIETHISEDFDNVESGESSLAIETDHGTYSRWFLQHSFEELGDWKQFTYFGLFFHGSRTAAEVAVIIDTPDVYNRGEWRFVDSFSGWKLIMFPLESPPIVRGNFSISEVRKIYIVLRSPNVKGLWNVDNVFLGKIVNNP